MRMGWLDGPLFCESHTALFTDRSVRHLYDNLDMTRVHAMKVALVEATNPSEEFTWIFKSEMSLATVTLELPVGTIVGSCCEYSNVGAETRTVP